MDRFIPTRANASLHTRTNRIGIIVALAATLLIAACGVSDPDALESVETMTVAVEPSSTDSADLQGQTLNGTVKVSIEAQGWMRTVRFYLDGTLSHTVSTAPFAYEIDTTALADGPHTLGIEALMANGRVRLEQTYEFFVANHGVVPPPPSTDDPADPADPETSEPVPGDPAEPKPAEPTTPLLLAAARIDPISAFDSVADASAATGRFIAQPSSVPASRTGVEVGSVAFDVDVAAEYALWVRVNGPDRHSDAVYVGFDGDTTRVYPSDHGTWTWLKVGKAYLEPGSRRVSIGYGEPGLRIDVIAVVGDDSIGAADLEQLATTATWNHVEDGPAPGDDEPAPAPTEPAPTPPAPSPTPPYAPAPAPRGLSMVGDPSFSRNQLSSAELLWYDRMWHAVDAELRTQVGRVGRDNVYEYGRTIYQFNHALLLGLRATGDLGFLDAVDETAQAMRAQLYDGWCDGVASTVYINAAYGTVSSPDGFLNFRNRTDGGIHRCRDTGDLNETLTAGHLALVMYAYHVNRDNPSPSGIDYGERADFWLDFLRNHFEAKWRQRSNVAWPNMDFIGIKWAHTYNAMNLYYYFVGQRLASDGHPDAQAYLTHSDVLSNAYFTQPYVPGERGGGFMSTNTPYGDAVVYSFGAPRNKKLDPSSTHLQAAPSTYARYALSAITVLTLEGNAYWDDAIMMRLANGVNAFVLDVPAITSRNDTLSPGVTGSETVAGIPPTSWKSRLTVGHYGNTTMPGLAIWDASGRIETLSLQIYGVLESNADSPASVHIPASMLLVESATTRDLGLTASR